MSELERRLDAKFKQVIKEESAPEDFYQQAIMDVTVEILEKYGERNIIDRRFDVAFNLAKMGVDATLTIMTSQSLHALGFRAKTGKGDLRKSFVDRNGALKILSHPKYKADLIRDLLQNVDRSIKGIEAKQRNQKELEKGVTRK